MMVFINDCYKAKTIYKPYAEGFVKMFSCFAPHLGEELKEKALALQNVQRQLEGKEVKKIIVVKGKVVNIVAK